MKVRCQRQAMLKALHTLSNVVIQTELHPILINVRITTSADGLIFRATDLSISLTYTLPLSEVEILEEGEVLLPAVKLYNLLKETPDTAIILEQEELNGVLLCNDGRFCLFGEDIKKFPEIEAFQENVSLELPGGVLQKLIKKTIFASTLEKTRFDLDNILIDFVDNNIMRVVATDGKRLATCETTYNLLGTLPSKSITIPIKCVQQIDKVLSSLNPETIQLIFSDNHILLKTANCILSSRLSDAKFPNYSKVIPQNLDAQVTCLHQDFNSALKRLCFMTDNKNKVVLIDFSPTTMRLSARSDAAGDAIIEMPCVFTGEPFEIKFNPNFLLDVLRVTEDNELHILLKNHEAPFLFKDGNDFQYLVLPLRQDD